MNNNKEYFPINAIINVTDECNLRCEYCFTNPHPTVMKLETGIAAIRWLVNNYEQLPDNKKANIHINFFGGEPMLRYEEFIIPLIEWADKNIKLSNGHSISWGMTTNGTLLTKERLRYLAMRKDFQILFSCDGAPTTQNMQRRTIDNKDSFCLIDNNINYLLEYFPNTTFRSTVTPRSVNKMLENYLYAKQRGFKNYFCMPNCREDWTLADIQEYAYQLSNIGWTIYQDIINQRSFLQYNDLISFMIKYITNAHELISCEHCGFGYTSVGIATNGAITACQERNTLDNSDKFFIGDIFTGINTEKRNQLFDLIPENHKRQNINLNCEICPIKEFCSGRICPSTCYDMTGNPSISNDIMCYWHICLYEVAKAICDTAALEDNQIFKEFLSSIGNSYKYL